MAKLRLARSPWLDRLARPARRLYPMLRRSTTVEVAIVGGGITGASVAWPFANAGIDVALLDAGLMGQGSTVASTALLMQETDADFRELAGRYGRHRAGRIWDLSRAATDD
jgi:glycine/D-amino acid oxidase-like deaminating enzyme